MRPQLFKIMSKTELLDYKLRYTGDAIISASFDVKELKLNISNIEYSINQYPNELRAIWNEIYKGFIKVSFYNNIF